MENPRPEKVAVVEEVKSRFNDAEAVVLTDYRGIDVPGMATLRTALREAGAEYQIYKNTLVRFAAQDLDLGIEEMLVGPTAIAFIRRDSNGDPVLMAKALREFAKTNPNLEIKGGILDDRPLTADDVNQLAQVAPRDELLARLAYGLAAPMVQFASLLQALPRNFAYGLQALIDKGGAPGAPADEPVAEEAPAEEASADEAPVEEAAAAEEAPAEEAPEATDETETTDEAPAETVTEETDAPAEEAEADDNAAEAATEETEAPAAEADADDPAADDAADTEES
jgi:large subunit ribosomal protein L10